MKNFKEIEREISEHLSSINENYSEAMAMIKTATERLTETYKEIAELEKKRDELKAKVEVKNVK